MSSGDEVADASGRKRVVEAYDAKHQVVMEGADKAALVIGNEDWPFPIPLVRKNGSWQFDTAAGRDEILFRRIGRNELRAIQTCLAYVDAQQEYAEKGVAGNGVYAQRIVSRPGKKDGLYWPAQSGDGRESAWRACRQRRGGGISRRPAAHAVSRLLLQGSHPAGAERARRRPGLRRARQHDWRFRAGRLSGRVPELGRDDVSGQPPRQGLRKGSGSGHRPHCRRHDGVQSGQHLATGERAGSVRGWCAIRWTMARGP